MYILYASAALECWYI